MRKLFRSFDRAGLRYLLISGQASILYGAATFSEDVDLWIDPTPGNSARLLRALAAIRARVHKLTPPPTPRNLRAGHGFHFRIPDRPSPIFLDVMARPPRVGPFQNAWSRRVEMRVEGLAIPVVSIPDLVLLKRTRRLPDYGVITNLVRIAVESEPAPRRSLLCWAAANCYDVELRDSYLKRLGVEKGKDRLRREILDEVDRLQRRDASYWRRIVADLRKLRRSGRLWPDDAPVADLL